MNMNAGSTRHQMLLGFKTKGKVCSTEAVFFKPFCTQRFPETDHKDNPFREDFAKFCFPRGLCVYPGPVDGRLLLPRTRTFVLTNALGNKTSGTCLIFYEA